MKLILEFVLKWIVSSFGLWLTVRLFGTGHETANLAAEASVFLVAGLILSIVNMLLKPIVALIALPITILTLGLFTLVVNGLMVYLALRMAPNIDITFGHAIIAGVIIGIANYAVNGIMKTSKH